MKAFTLMHSTPNKFWLLHLSQYNLEISTAYSYHPQLETLKLLFKNETYLDFLRMLYDGKKCDFLPKPGLNI